jgi:hypothetical protein
MCFFLSNESDMQVAIGAERRCRMCHNFNAVLPLDEDNLLLYLKDKHIVERRIHREVVPGIRDGGHVNADEYCTVVIIQVLLFFPR